MVCHVGFHIGNLKTLWFYNCLNDYFGLTFVTQLYRRLMMG